MTEEQVKEIVLKTMIEIAQEAEELRTESFFNDYGEAAKNLLTQNEHK